MRAGEIFPKDCSQFDEQTNTRAGVYLIKFAGLKRNFSFIFKSAWTLTVSSGMTVKMFWVCMVNNLLPTSYKSFGTIDYNKTPDKMHFIEKNLT